MPSTAATPPSDAPLLLVVDDSPDVRLFLRKLLSGQGYRTALASGGEECIRLARDLRPDCVLLDVHMPDMDGYGVCRALKAAPETADTPVLFLTATADDPAAVVTGLAAGGNDYIGKPVDRDVLLARVSVALRLRAAELTERRAREAAEEAYRQLRTAKADLALAHKMNGLAVLAAGLAHELNSPLSALTTNLQFVDGELRVEDAAQVPLEDCRDAVREGIECCGRISAIVQRMRQLGESARARSTGPVDVVARVRAIGEEQAHKHAAAFRLSGAEEAVVHGVDAELGEALGAVLENAFVAASSTRGAEAKVEVEVRRDDERWTIRVDDNGPGIPAEDLPYIFDPFFTRKASWRSVGLGLGVALSILTRHGGRIEVQGHGALGGAEVRIELPVLSSPTEGGLVRAPRPDIPTLR